MRGQVAFLAIIAVLIIVGVVGTVMIFSTPSTPPPQVTGSQSFAVEQCAQSAFEESLALVGLYGGWLEPIGDSFDMGGQEFALWDAPGSIPGRADLQAQVRKDLLSRLDRCTFDLEGSRETSVDVQLGASSSRAAIEIDASVRLDGADQRLSPFVVESRLPIMRARDTADAFVNELWDKEVLTDLNFELISINPHVPLEGVEFSCTPKRWSVSEVSDSFFSSVEDSAAYLSFDGTPRAPGDLQRRFTFDLGLPPEVEVSAYYFTEFGGDLAVDQSTGDIMSSHVIANPDGSICQNTYQFWYSMNYPIVFTLMVPSQTDDYLFRFAVPVSVQRNQESETRQASDSTFCSDVTPRLFSLDVIDANTGLALDDVRATFVCGSERCPLASTSGGIEDHLPARCLSASIVLDKDGYAQKQVDYRYDRQVMQPVELEPLRRIGVELVCADEPCSFSDSLIARIDGRQYPLRLGENLVPKDPDRVLVIENPPSGPRLVADLTLRSGDGVIVIDTDKYDSPGGYSTEQIFGSHVIGDAS